MPKRSDEKLRRQLEILKAQVKSQQFGEKESKLLKETLNVEHSAGPLDTAAFQKTAGVTLNYSLIRKELFRTVLFSIFATSGLIALHLTQQRWLPLIKFI